KFTNDLEVSKRLEQGAQPWTVEEPPSQKLSDVHTADYLIKANPTNQGRQLWQALPGNNKMSTHERTDVGGQFNLDSNQSLNQSVKIGLTSSVMPEQSPAHRNSFIPGDPHEEHDGKEEEIFHRIRGHSLRYPEHLSHQGIVHFQQRFACCARGKALSKETACARRAETAEGTACNCREHVDAPAEPPVVVQGRPPAGQSPCTVRERGDPAGVEPGHANAHRHAEGAQGQCYEREANLRHSSHTRQPESAQNHFTKTRLITLENPVDGLVRVEGRTSSCVLTLVRIADNEQIS
ncbi:Zinc finger protein 717, partial [Galemys pyrenaicus]